MTHDGGIRAMNLQVVDVRKPLGSVSRICAAGHRVVFDDEGSYIEHKTSGEINWLREEGGNYMLDVWVVPRDLLNTGNENRSSFHGQRW